MIRRTSVPRRPIPYSTFETRRVRLEANIAVEDWIKGRVEADFALARLQLKQVWMALELDPAFIIRGGQFKKPFSVIELTSSTQGAVIERGLRIRNLDPALLRVNDDLAQVRGVVLPGEEYALLAAQNYLSYDLGVAVEGSYGVLGWSVGAFNGAGADLRDENSVKAFAGRVTVAPDIGTPLRFGAGLSHNELNWPNATSLARRSGNAFEVDAELGAFRRGVWLLAEATRGENLASQETFMGAQGVLSYFHSTGAAKVEGIEPVVRVSWADPDDTIDNDAGMLFTPGFNVYFYGRNRLMFNLDLYKPQDERIDTHHAFRAQMNLHF